MNIANALVYLFPTADRTRDYLLQDDGAGPYIAAWRLQQAQPTVSQLQTASDAYDTQQAQLAADASALRTRVLTIAQSAVGIAIDQLTATQVRALIAVLLWKAGALDKNGVVQPLNTWV